MATWSDSQSTLVAGAGSDAEAFHRKTRRIRRLLYLSCVFAHLALVIDGLQSYFWSRYTVPGVAVLTILHDIAIVLWMRLEGKTVTSLPAASRTTNIIFSSVIFIAWASVFAVYLYMISQFWMKTTHNPHKQALAGAGAVKTVVAMGMTLSLLELIVYVAMLRCISLQRDEFETRNCQNPQVALQLRTSV